MKKTVRQIALTALLLVSSSAFADQFGIRPDRPWRDHGGPRDPGPGPLRPPPSLLSLSLVGQSRNGTYVNTSGGTIQLVRNDSIRLRAEVRDERGNVVNIPPVRIRQNYFNNIQVSINYNGELEIQTTNRPSLSTEYITVEAQVGFRTQSLQIGIQVIKPSFPGFSRQGAIDMATRCYYAILLRAPDQDGLRSQSKGILAKGGVNGLVDVVRNMANSPEFNSVTRAQHSSAEIVQAIYHNLLDRDVDQSGLSFYAGMIDRGQAAAALQQIVTGKEFLELINP